MGRGKNKYRRAKNRGLVPHQGNPAALQSPQVSTAVGLQVRQESSFAGPIPPPIFLKEYDAILPGLADRIVQMAEKQEAHRHNLENKAVSAEINRGYLGMASGLLVALAGLCIGGLLLYHSKVVEGSLFAGGTLVALVYVFVSGNEQRRKERENKTRIMAGKG